MSLSKNSSQNVTCEGTVKELTECLCLGGAADPKGACSSLKELTEYLLQKSSWNVSAWKGCVSQGACFFLKELTECFSLKEFAEVPSLKKLTD